MFVGLRASSSCVYITLELHTQNNYCEELF